MRRQEQMHAETQSRFDEFGDGLAQIQNSLSGLEAPAREAVNSYLAKSQEWQPLKKLIEEGALPEAENALKERLEEVDQLLDEHPEVESFFRDHRQDLLLKMALVLSQQGYSCNFLKLTEKLSEVRAPVDRLSKGFRVIRGERCI